MVARLKDHWVPFDGGIEERYGNIQSNPGNLLNGINVENKTDGGYGRILGYTRYDSTEVPGTGGILGVWRYDGAVYAFRNWTDGTTARMYSSTGSGWTLEHSGLTKDGSYEFVNEDFAGTQKMYGASGVHKAFEWDGTTWTDITTGMTTDTPDHLIAFKKHLFLSFGRSVQNSGLGTPGTWTVITGANELAVADDVTGFMRLSGGVLGIFTRNGTFILSGSSTADFVNTNMAEHGLQVGALPATLQQMGKRVYYLDDRGIVDFYTSQDFGDFDDATISYSINKFLRTQSSLIASSVVVRNKTQYRLFFTDGTGMIVALSGTKVKGITRTIFTDSAGAALPVRHTCSTENANGNELILFSSDDGYVRVMEDGDNFEGYAIESYIQTFYTHAKRPMFEKQWQSAVLDIKSEGVSEIRAEPNFQLQKPEGIPTQVSLIGSNSILGSALLGSAILGANPVQQGKVHMPGHSEYVNMTIYSNADEPAWEIKGILYQYLPGKRQI